MPFYVLDAENNTLWAGKEQDDGPVVFKTLKSAERRAKSVAEREPGRDIQIVATVAVARCDVAKPKVRRA